MELYDKRLAGIRRLRRRNCRCDWRPIRKVHQIPDGDERRTCRNTDDGDFLHHGDAHRMTKPAELAYKIVTGIPSALRADKKPERRRFERFLKKRQRFCKPVSYSAQYGTEVGNVRISGR